MKNNTTTIFDILQTSLTEEEVKKVSESLGYVDTARRFTLYDLIKFFIAAATFVKLYLKSLYLNVIDQYEEF